MQEHDKTPDAPDADNSADDETADTNQAAQTQDTQDTGHTPNDDLSNLSVPELIEPAAYQEPPASQESPDSNPISNLEDKLAAANDQLLRTLAELENTRRRAERDRSEALKYGAMAFARDIVSAVDNLQRALKAMQDAPEEAKNDSLTALMEGVAATERDLLAGLGRHKVTPISPMGEKFDPNLHEALFEAPDTDKPAGTIIEVVEIGYMMDERLLRPAKVGIAKNESEK